MILARRHGEWMLAAFAPHLRGCNLSTVVRPLHDSERFHLWQGHTYVWSHAPIDDVEFFPEVEYRGMKVSPQRWELNGGVPMLRCVLMGPAITDSGAVRRIVEARVVADRTQRASDEDAWRALVVQAETAGRALRGKLVADGWEDAGREGLYGLVTVDELSKTSGPPPND